MQSLLCFSLSLHIETVLFLCWEHLGPVLLIPPIPMSLLYFSLFIYVSQSPAWECRDACRELYVFPLVHISVYYAFSFARVQSFRGT